MTDKQTASSLKPLWLALGQPPESWNGRARIALSLARGKAATRVFEQFEDRIDSNRPVANFRKDSTLKTEGYKVFKDVLYEELAKESGFPPPKKNT